MENAHRHFDQSYSIFELAVDLQQSHEKIRSILNDYLSRFYTGRGGGSWPGIIRIGNSNFTGVVFDRSIALIAYRRQATLKHVESFNDRCR